MEIVASSIGLSSAYQFEALSRTRETAAVRAVPAGEGDRYLQGRHHQERDVAKLTRLLQRYFDAAADSKETERLAARIDRLVKRIEARMADATAPEAPAVEVRYRREDRYVEREAMSYRAAGSVTTADGRQIDFQQALDLARVYARSESVSVRLVGRLGEAATTAAPTAPAQPAQSVSGSQPVPGSQSVPGFQSVPGSQPVPGPTRTRSVLEVAGGVLGIDVDGDGAIDPKRELLGASGDAFAELARFDEDGNGFIDEGDSVFGRLAVVSEGTDGLEATAAKTKGLGAIYLGSVETPFTARDTTGAVSSRLVRSGVYLMESGDTGIARQVDLVI